MIPACGPPSSLSPENVMTSAPSAIACTAAGSPASQAGGAPFSHGHVGVEQAASDVGHHGHVEGGEFGDRRLLDEAFDAVVARMDLHHHRDVGAGSGDRPLVVGERGCGWWCRRRSAGSPTAPSPRAPGTIRRSRRSRRDSPARRGLSASAASDQQHRRCVVVDDHRVLGAREPGEELADGGLARAALTGRQVELDRLGLGGLANARAAPDRGWCGAAHRWR